MNRYISALKRLTVFNLDLTELKDGSRDNARFLRPRVTPKVVEFSNGENVFLFLNVHISNHVTRTSKIKIVGVGSATREVGLRHWPLTSRFLDLKRRMHRSSTQLNHLEWDYFESEIQITKEMEAWK